MILCTPARSQVIELSAGASTLLGARGASVQVYGRDYSARIGLGFQNGRQAPRIGGFLETSYRGLKWELGDRPLSFVLPTDLFGGSAGFLGRGVAVSRATPGHNLLLFAGATSSSLWTPYFQAGEARVPTSLFYYDRALLGALRGFSRNVISTRPTSIHGLAWT